MSGPIATRGGLLFVASIGDESLRAYDSKTGQELWRGKLPGARRCYPYDVRLAQADNMW